MQLLYFVVKMINIIHIVRSVRVRRLLGVVTRFRIPHIVVTSHLVEVYPRPDGTIYICGIGGSDYISTDELRRNAYLYNCPPNEQRVQAAISSFQSMVSTSSVAYTATTQDDLDRTQACMRPCPPDAMPYMGAIPGCDGLYINAGHNCWYVRYWLGFVVLLFHLIHLTHCVCLFVWGTFSGVLHGHLLAD
jgi:glycine/D-amino acid oxidase-like deaminating enzyme